MLVLAIDTATQVSSVAVASEGRLLSELTMQGKLTHSETLLPHIEQVLKMAAVDKSQLTGIVVSNGPGSFTGLRIGLAAAKAMSYVLGIPLVGVSTLQAMAYQLPVPGVRLMCLLDAQKGNAYVESYKWENNTLQVVEAVKKYTHIDITKLYENSIVGAVAAAQEKEGQQVKENLEKEAMEARKKKIAELTEKYKNDPTRLAMLSQIAAELNEIDA